MLSLRMVSKPIAFLENTTKQYSGGYPKIVKEGINDDYLPVWMQAAGYQTYYTGKLWNTHNIDNYNNPHVNGFNGSDFLLDPFTYDYWHARMTRNGAPPEDYSGQYSPDVIAEKASGFLDQAMENDAPFFLTVAPIAPHSNIFGAPALTDSYSAALAPGGPGFAIPEYAPRHAHLFKDYEIPRGENFNPEKVCETSGECVGVQADNSTAKWSKLGCTTPTLE